MSDLPDTVTIRSELRPGDWGALISLHGAVYCTEFGFAPEFEAYVAGTVAEYVMGGGGGKVWLAESGDRLAGCTAVVHRRAGERMSGQLRWVLLHPALRGKGIGRDLLTRALAYCRACAFDRVYLETTDGLHASLKLYLDAGFKVVEDVPTTLWGETRHLVKMELDLS